MIDDIFFERNVGRKSSDVTATEKESFTDQQKKDKLKNTTCISEPEEEVYRE